MRPFSNVEPPAKGKRLGPLRRLARWRSGPRMGWHENNENGGCEASGMVGFIYNGGMIWVEITEASNKTFESGVGG